MSNSFHQSKWIHDVGSSCFCWPWLEMMVSVAWNEPTKLPGKKDDNYCRPTSGYLGSCLIPPVRKGKVWLVRGLRWYPFSSYSCPRQVSNKYGGDWEAFQEKEQINYAHSWNTDRSPERQVKISISSEVVVKQGVLQSCWLVCNWYPIFGGNLVMWLNNLSAHTYSLTQQFHCQGFIL